LLSTEKIRRWVCKSSTEGSEDGGRIRSMMMFASKI
jgi:hypothetical protein